jgi:hypothetical protein
MCWVASCTRYEMGEHFSFLRACISSGSRVIFLKIIVTFKFYLLSFWLMLISSQFIGLDLCIMYFITWCN